LERLAEHHTVVRYDMYGCGLSDRERSDFSLEADLRSLEAVVDQLKLRRFALLGALWGGPSAIAYAAKYPRRVSQLILYGTRARVDQAEGELTDATIAMVRMHSGIGHGAMAARHMPGADAADVDWFVKLRQATATPEMLAKLLEHYRYVNVMDPPEAARLYAGDASARRHVNPVRSREGAGGLDPQRALRAPGG